MSDEELNQIQERIKQATEELGELQQELDRSLVIQRVFPEAFASGTVTLRWGSKEYFRDQRSIHRISLREFSEGVSLTVIKGNGGAFSADTEDALELLSEGIGPKPLVECLQAIKARHSRKPKVRTRAFKKRRGQ